MASILTNLEILTAALELPPTLRATIAEKFLDSLETRTQKEIEALWAEEAERRITAFEQGRIRAIPAEQVFATLSSAKK